jgi:transcriptional regulator with XRE-family HTH domain
MRHHATGRDLLLGAYLAAASLTIGAIIESSDVIQSAKFRDGERLACRWNRHATGNGSAADRRGEPSDRVNRDGFSTQFLRSTRLRHTRQHSNRFVVKGTHGAAEVLGGGPWRQAAQACGPTLCADVRRGAYRIDAHALRHAMFSSGVQIQKYENGANRISASRLQRTAHILQVPIPFFFEGAPGGHNLKTAPPLDYVDEFVSSSEGLRLISRVRTDRPPETRRRIVSLAFV